MNFREFLQFLAFAPLIVIVSVILTGVVLSEITASVVTIAIISVLMSLVWSIRSYVRRKPVGEMKGAEAPVLKQEEIAKALERTARPLRLTEEKVEELASLILAQYDYNVTGDVAIESRDGAPIVFDLIATRGDVALIVEAKDRTAASPDIDSFLSRLSEVNLSPIIGARRIVPVLIARDFTRTVWEIAERKGVKTVKSNSLESLSLLNKFRVTPS